MSRRPTVSAILATMALFIVLGGSAVAAGKIVNAGDIATGAVTSRAIKNAAVMPQDLSASARASLQGLPGTTGAAGTPGATGASGTPGTPGASGTPGAPGAAGAAGSNGANGANGPNGPNGVDGIDGIDGTNGTDGADGQPGADGVLAPLSTKSASVALPTGSTPTVVLDLSVPAGNYVVFAKSQLSQTGAGDSVTCKLKAGSTVIDQVAMKTQPALAAVPASMQAVTTTSPTDLSFECTVSVANGSADFNSLIALPIQ